MRIFIASASRDLELVTLVSELVRELDHEPHRWNRPGELPGGKTVIEAIEMHLQRSDAALCIASATDVSVQRGVEVSVPRDNVILEYGLFAGRLGRTRVGLMVVEGSEAATLPTDLLGINRLSLRSRADEPIESYKDALRPVLRTWLEGVEDDPVQPLELLRLLSQHLNEVDAQQFSRQIRGRRLQNMARCTDQVLSQLIAPAWRDNPEGAVGAPGHETALKKVVSLDSLRADCLTLLASTLLSFAAKTIPDIDQLAIAALGAPKFSAAIQEKLSFPTTHTALVYRPTANGHDLIGTARPGAEVLILYDVVVSGYQVVKCAEAIRQRGARVSHVCSLIHYKTTDRDATQLLAANQLAFHSVVQVESPQ